MNSPEIVKTFTFRFGLPVIFSFPLSPGTNPVLTLPQGLTFEMAADESAAADNVVVHRKRDAPWLWGEPARQAEGNPVARGAPFRHGRGMFTGIVEATGRVARLQTTAAGGRLELGSVPFAGELALGESVAVNGCCLTVVASGGDSVKFDLLQQTLRLTNLGSLAAGDAVNLERAMHAAGRFSGHFVQGHVDGTGEILAWEPHGQDYRLEVSVPAELHRLIIPRGSITIDGISLTAAETGPSRVTAWITPHTRTVTNLTAAAAGKRVNLEIDMLAKYVEQLLVNRASVAP